MRRYEANIRAELSAADRPATGGHGWFTTTADNHTKHEVCAQDKTIISTAIAGWRQGPWAPGDPRWETIPCDIIHQPLPANCAQNVEPGADPITGVIPPWDPEPKVAVFADKVAPYTQIISRQDCLVAVRFLPPCMRTAPLLIHTRHATSTPFAPPRPRATSARSKGTARPRARSGRRDPNLRPTAGRARIRSAQENTTRVEIPRGAVPRLPRLQLRPRQGA